LNSSTQHALPQLPKSGMLQSDTLDGPFSGGPHVDTGTEPLPAPPVLLLLLLLLVLLMMIAATPAITATPAMTAKILRVLPFDSAAVPTGAYILPEVSSLSQSRGSDFVIPTAPGAAVAYQSGHSTSRERFRDSQPLVFSR
jgi:hypothetical protein